MNEELLKLFAEKGLGICEVCEVPFTLRRAGQRTCGSKECVRILHRRNDREKHRREMIEVPERCRERHRAAAARYRKKKRKKEEWLGRMREILESNTRLEEQNEDFAYGQRQTAGTLKTVSKIDVNLEGSNEE